MKSKQTPTTFDFEKMVEGKLLDIALNHAGLVGRINDPSLCPANVEGMRRLDFGCRWSNTKAGTNQGSLMLVGLTPRTKAALSQGRVNWLVREHKIERPVAVKLQRAFAATHIGVLHTRLVNFAVTMLELVPTAFDKPAPITWEERARFCRAWNFEDNKEVTCTSFAKAFNAMQHFYGIRFNAERPIITKEK